MVQIKQIDEQFYVEDNGELLPISGKNFLEKKTGITWYKLPENSSNRKLIDARKMVDGYELTVRETRIVGVSSGKKSLTEYMSEEDLAEYNAIIARAEKAREEAKAKAQSPEEKLRAQIERLTAKLAELSEE